MEAASTSKCFLRECIAYNIRTRTGDDYMLDVNMIIAKNIQAELKKETKIKC